MIKIIALLSTLFVNLYGAIFLAATSSKQYKSRFFLALFLFNSFLLFVGHFLSFTEYWSAFRYFDFLFLASLLAFYPFYFMYIYSAFNFSPISTKWIYHFAPSIIVAILMLYMVLNATWEDYQLYMLNNLYSTELNSEPAKKLAFIYKGSRMFHLIQIVFYNFLTIRFLFSAKNKMNDFYSNLDEFQLKYFYIVTISFILLMSIPGFYVTLIGRTPLNDNDLQLLYMCTLFTILYIILTIVGLRQIPVELNINPDTNLDKEETPLQELQLLEKNLLRYFNTNKPWLNPHLNILDVAKQIGTNRSYVSKVINESLGCNFNFFVNNYRIEEAKKLLIKRPELTIAEVSELSGFGSVNSFIRIFRSIENYTPTEFKNNR